MGCSKGCGPATPFRKQVESFQLVESIIFKKLSKTFLSHFVKLSSEILNLFLADNAPLRLKLCSHHAEKYFVFFLSIQPISVFIINITGFLYLSSIQPISLFIIN